MHNINLQGILRSLSIILVFLIVLLSLGLNILSGDIVLESGNSQLRKEYEYIDNSKSTNIPEFTYKLKSFFVKQSVPVIVETKIVTESIIPSAPPSLKFVGMIETEDKIIYSFRNMNTNKLLLFEEGVEMSGITLIFASWTGYTLKKNEIIFQVDKK